MNRTTLGQILCFLHWIAAMIAPLHAAKIGQSESRFTVTPSGIDGEVTFHWQDLTNYFAMDENRNGVLETAELNSWKDGLEALCETFFTLWVGSNQYQLATTDLQFDPRRNLLVFRSEWKFPDHAEPFEAFDIAFVAMEDMAASHAHDLTVVDTDDQVLFHEVFSQTPGKGRARPELPSMSNISHATITATAASTSGSRLSILWFVLLIPLLIAVPKLLRGTR